MNIYIKRYLKVKLNSDTLIKYYLKIIIRVFWTMHIKTQ